MRSTFTVFLVITLVEMIILRQIYRSPFSSRLRTMQFASKWNFFSSLTSRLESLRNIGIVAHIDAGKTTTTEQILFVTGEIKSIGRVDSGDTVMDYLPQERERGITISSAAISMSWKKFSINLIDTPGHVDFTIEVERSLRVLDGCVIIIDAVAGVQAQTKTVWKQSKKRNIPAILFINKMDRIGASFERSLETFKSQLDTNPIPIQYPIINDDQLSGIIDLISMQKFLWDRDNHANSTRNNNPPVVESLQENDELYQISLQKRFQMIEKIAELDEKIMDVFLTSLDPKENNEISNLFHSNFTSQMLVDALRRVCITNLGIPVVCGASLKGIGIEPLLDASCYFLPSPLDRPPSIATQEKYLNNKKTKEHVQLKITPEFPDFYGLVFKVEVDVNRGLMAYIRSFSGQLSLKTPLLNTTRGYIERPTHILNISANNFAPISSIETGEVACLLGLKNTFSGDTLTVVDDSKSTKSKHGDGYALEGLSIPLAVYSLSIEPEKSSQQKELDNALKILCVEDPSLIVERDNESGQTILRGIGELHLDIVCDKLRNRFHVDVCTGRAYIAYRESLLENMYDNITYEYDRTIGPKRLYASMKLTIKSSSLSTIQPCEVEVQESVRSVLRSEELDSLMDGLHAALVRGPRGYPVIGLHVTVEEVGRDPDTTPGAIRACAAMLIDHLLKGDSGVILEPLMTVEIEVPNKYLGGVLSDLTVPRRGTVKEVISKDYDSKVMAYVPLATMLGYSTTFRSLTQGEGIFSLEYCEHSLLDFTIFNEALK